MSNSGRQIGRNEPCPCGSEKKYKRCHGKPNREKAHPPYPLDMADAEKKLKEMQAAEIQRAKQQGLGRPIISTIIQGYRFIAVGGSFTIQRSGKHFMTFLLST